MTGLEALEEISKCDVYVEGLFERFFGLFSEEYNIIKEELKDYEKLKEEKLLLSACRDLPTLEKKLKALNEILALHDKWLRNEISDFEFFTLLVDIRDKYGLLKLYGGKE